MLFDVARRKLDARNHDEPQSCNQQWQTRRHPSAEGSPLKQHPGLTPVARPGDFTGWPWRQGQTGNQPPWRARRWPGYSTAPTSRWKQRSEALSRSPPRATGSSPTSWHSKPSASAASTKRNWAIAAPAESSAPTAESRSTEQPAPRPPDVNCPMPCSPSQGPSEIDRSVLKRAAALGSQRPVNLLSRYMRDGQYQKRGGNQAGVAPWCSDQSPMHPASPSLHIRPHWQAPGWLFTPSLVTAPDA